MTFRAGLLAARGHIVFLLGLAAAFGIIFALETWDAPHGAAVAGPVVEASADIPEPAHAPLDATEMRAAEIAWAYFARNIRPETGLADAVANFPATTMWDTGSFLLAAVAAERLGILPRAEFDTIVARALETLASLQLYADLLPNKSYDTTTLAMTDYANLPVDGGIGWSALDIGRLLISFDAIRRHHPRHAEAVQEVLNAWQIDAAVRDGVLIGAQPSEDGGLVLLQEGRVGYERYAAKGFALFGYDVHAAIRLDDTLRWVEVSGVDIPTDARGDDFGGHVFTVSDPFIMDGVEFGWDTVTRELAWRVYRAQENRYRETGILTAVNEDHIDRAPHFIYSTVLGDGVPWAVLTDNAGDASGFRILSTKAALGWHALYQTDYTTRLEAAVADQASPEGWATGPFEEIAELNTARAANTNGVILTAMHYRAFGPLLHPIREGRELDARVEQQQTAPLRAGSRPEARVE
ncbi:DUF3131 domain-containing protein [Paracoccus tibetensis]|uniref:DUF3131 domain-containing protein n=1 Tax=Paracoccus tibetensis TaxID=336292 RepID=A0A1G5JK89_9RHOB|nr:DUF3131 domain-containing protein [Paracoccus tibetensis]SCY88812.1 Protein of unknown function [Paracoccus tibetensis]